MNFAALLSLLLLAQDIPTYRANVQFIRVDVQVLSRNQSVLGLKQSDFRVWDEGQPQAITNFGAENQPLDLILLLDVSSSTTPIEDQIKDSAARALTLLEPADRVGVVLFYSHPLLVIQPTTDKARVEEAIRKIRWGRAGTELNLSSLKAALYLDVQSRPEARRAIVILTDNVGYAATPDYRVIDGLWRSDVIYNGLLFGRETAGADVRLFAAATGGEILQFKHNSIPFDEMFRRIRERYSILYRSPGGEVGDIRKIKVDLTSELKGKYPNLKIRARAGYRVTDAP